jgi:hypothetical protein
MFDSPLFLPRDASEIETVAENHFGDQMISRARQSHRQSKINFPFGREIQVDCGKNLALLLEATSKKRPQTRDLKFTISPCGSFMKEN